jgi:hypothetical protein
MSMEKNGEIGRSTPGCRSCGCGKQKQASVSDDQLPSTEVNRLDCDLSKEAAAVVSSILERKNEKQ